jgi:hypothetical protein
VNWLVLATVVMTLAAVLAVAYALSLRAEPEIRMGTQHEFVGAQAPASSLENLDKTESTDLIALRGKLVLMIFWGPWDYTSAQLAPFWEQVWQRHRDDPHFAMVTVACEPPQQTLAGGERFTGEVRAFLERAGATFPVWRDPDGTARSPYYMDQAVYPLTVLIDPEGYLRALWYGPVPGMQAELDRLVQRYLEEFGN